MHGRFALLLLLLLGCERERRADAVETGAGAVDFSEDMTRPPGIKSPPSFMCSREALQAQAAGMVLANCLVTTEGELRDCRIERSIPLLDPMALDVLARWNVGAITYQGQPVAVRYKIPIRLVCGPREEAQPESETMKQDTERYYASIAMAVKRHHDVSSIPEGDRAALTTDLMIRIDEDGKLRDVKVVKSSGNAMFDELVLAAVRGADPFDPPPPSLRAPLRDRGVQVRIKP